MAEKREIPKDKPVDSTLGFLKDGYLFISNRMKQYETDIFTARLLGKKIIFLMGKEGAELFYKEEYFKRSGVTPMRVQKTLFGKKAVQGLDGKTHKKRKSLFLSLLTPDYEKELLTVCGSNLDKYARQWEAKEVVNLYEESKKILFESVCQWAGIPYEKEKVPEYAEYFGLMIYGFGRIGKNYRKGKHARKIVEAWIKGIITDVREGTLVVDTKSPLYQVSMYDEEDGMKLPAQIAAVEVINIIRPIIAIATYITFEAVALEAYPECKDQLQKRDPQYTEMFCQEVRRFYPFAPFVGAKVKQDFEWNGYSFKLNQLVMLDIYGTNHDTKLWDEPYEFRPERFAKREKNLYDFIPQGGGKMAESHRCAGDITTLKIMEVFAEYLVNGITYDLPEQDLEFSLKKIPTLPNSGVVLSNIRKISK